jgi:hypothetical protein
MSVNEVIERWGRAETRKQELITRRCIEGGAVPPDEWGTAMREAAEAKAALLSAAQLLLMSSDKRTL